MTYSDPTSIPMGVSPDCSDMQFAPGGTSSRDCFKKVFASAFGAVTVTYSKSYVDPKGVIRNLYLDSAGNLWVENVTASPGTYSHVLDNNGNPVVTTPGSWAKSCTAFGREYIAISDTLHGADIPLQYDGVNIDRVTQDGPGGSPSISSISLPSVAMLGPATGPIVLTLTESDPAGGDGSGFYTAINMYTSSSVDAVNIGSSITVAGYGGSSAAMNGTWTVTGIFPGTTSLVILSAYLAPGTVFSTAAATGTVVGSSGGVTMTRSGNIVTVTTGTTVAGVVTLGNAHQLQPGYQAQITGVTAATVGTSISSIVINNENLPGLAVVTTATAHGLVPGLKVSLVGVAGTSVGGGISTIVRNGQVVTVTTASANGVNPGAIVTIAGVTTTSFNTTAVVQNVTSPTTFTYIQVDVDASDSTGTVTLNWPIFNTATPTYFEVVSAPTTTSFQIQINYSDGSWSGGTVTYAWNGTFFVKEVIDLTTFQYQQYGPDATTTVVGKVTPYGQAAPGKRQMVCFFITRQGYTTKYSPPALIVSNGGQYLSVTNIPIGPSNVVARVLAFTGAEGAYFYYIPAPPQVNGQLVGTSTVINDNTTTSTILDFSDPTLFAGLGISIAGNNLANQTILDGALGFAKYASRIITYGQRNTIQNLLNPGFDGGYFPLTPTKPTGWDGGGAGVLATGHYGSGWTTSGTPLTQSMYEDFSGAPIATGSSKYTFRAWVSAAGTVTATISSASATFSSSATLTATGAGWYEHAFSLAMPTSIPSDMILGITGSGVIVDEISIIYTDNPYSLSLLGSYVNNPEAFDGVSGRFAPADDTHQTLALGIIRNNLYMLTRDPGGRIHQTTQGATEPSRWQVDEVGQNCGTVSAFALAVSQANDNTGGGGEEWISWYSFSGPRIFGGEFPFKIAQEIMRRKGQRPPGAPDDLSNTNVAALNTVWAINDWQSKVMYFGVPMNTATAPSAIWMLSYLGCETAGEIASQDPVHRAASTGKMTSNDLGRKWSPWARPMNSAAMMFRSDGSLETVFCAGNGLAPNTSSSGAYGNVYTLDATKYTDDDYGIVVPYYITASLPDPELAQGLGIGGGLKLLAYSYGLIDGVGTMTLSIRYNLLSKIWPITQASVMTTAPNNDTEFAGGQATGKRFWIRFASTPTTGTDNYFEVNNWLVAIKKNPRMPVRGSNR